ncbi:PREDICTED: SWI/SNF complex subunit SWI3A [Populus euphratica]|uniref:SWI/SNF complex subunit SWI3A n=1 Tax=Populus euphratica TaxID=75702 RepID=A0AAJ6XMB9_POPEU|nr:PREDICTED: SWI/SNF complex subunit SWI3A [Populus euphratica]
MSKIMEPTAHSDPNLNPIRPNEPELDLYTIPSYSSWFSWHDIHETERVALREFFDGSSITRTPKIYKEYRDFIINKYREDPSRRLTFTEIRKSLVGDVSLLNKVFLFLNNWGLINFSCEKNEEIGLGSGNVDVRVEDGAPNGVRIVEMPDKLKPISVGSVQSSAEGSGGGGSGSGLKLPPLASYSDVFGELVGKKKEVVCGNCGGSCDSGQYEYSKGDYLICQKCFNDGSYGENKSKDDFKLKDSASNAAVWTEEETLRLLESVSRHGNDWDLVAQNVKTKTKLDCISKLIELPFGDLLLSSTYGKGNSSGQIGSTNNSIQVPAAPSEHQDDTKHEDQLHEQMNANEEKGDVMDDGPLLKRRRITSVSDAGGSLMKQVALISTMVGPDITAAAAEAAVAALCDETACPREIFDGEEDFPSNGFSSPSFHSKSKRVDEVDASEVKQTPTQSGTEEASAWQNDIPLSLRLRAAVATTLGAAAAHAKLLADQEDREVENLMATIVETQLKKLHHKIKHFDDLELIMEKEYAEFDELTESLTEERIDVLQRAIRAGISKSRDHAPIKFHMSNVV